MARRYGGLEPGRRSQLAQQRLGVATPFLTLRLRSA